MIHFCLLVITLVRIRLRKFLPAGDTLAFALFFIGYFLLFALSFKYYEQVKYVILLFVLEPFVLHWKRTDLELLKTAPSYKFLIFAEYAIYALPYFVLCLVLGNALWICVWGLVVLWVLHMPQISFKTIAWPFQVSDVFWVAYFRKYKLYAVLAVLVFLVVQGLRMENSNLVLFVLIAMAGILAWPSFEREKVLFIRLSDLGSRQYMWTRMRAAVLNAAIYCAPVLVCLAIFAKWDLMLLALLLPLSAAVFQVFKYAFFDNLILHYMALFAFFGLLAFGGFVVLPFVYYRAIKNLNKWTC